MCSHGGTCSCSTGRQLAEDASNFMVVTLVKSEQLHRNSDIVTLMQTTGSTFSLAGELKGVYLNGSFTEKASLNIILSISADTME